ncbi:MAG: O-antigen ligase family protein, partial [Solirubrobacteraceae bacterium]
RPSPDLLVGLALAAGLCAEAFVTTGGVSLRANTWAEVVLTFVGAALCAAALLYSTETRLWGAWSLVLFGALAALTLASISWSVQPANSWVEANRTISYLAAFAGALALARLAPRRWPAVIGAIATLATILAGYALLLKVYPASLDPREVLGRLRAPFDYWNAVGLMAALGLPACLWAGARREGNIFLRALTVPAMAILLVALILSYSRGALLAALIGVALWFALVPLRFRALTLLALSAAGGAAVTLWALDTHPITHDMVPLRARTIAGHSFGLALLLMIVLLAAAGLAAVIAMDQATLSRRLRRQVGIGLIAVAACVPVAGVGLVAASSRGLTGEISHVWDQLTSTKAPGPGNSAGRLVQVSNSRARYWREGLTVGSHDLLLGVGAVGYGTARTRYSQDKLIADHAHSYVIETFADFGLIGVLLSLALLIAWTVAAGRTLGARQPRALARATAAARARRRALTMRAAGDSGTAARPRPTSGAVAPLSDEQALERAGLLTMLAVVVVFGVHSTIDWTWFVPGVTVPALMCAGWLAGRGPITRPVPELKARHPLQVVKGRLHVNEPLRLAGVAVIAAIALVCAWMIVQPLRSSDADQASVNALADGKLKLALSDANTALSREPVSVEPLWNLSAIYGTLGNTTRAKTELVNAVRLQPSNYSTWLQLAEFDLQVGKPREALALLNAALYLYPYSPETLSAVAQARSQIIQQQRATARSNRRRTRR